MTMDRDRRRLLRGLVAVALAVSPLGSVAAADASAGSDPTGARADIEDLLPRELRGWRAEPPDSLYDAETLHDHMDGDAEVFRHLNVKSVLARRYVRTGFPEILADIFDMGSSADAFGAFHHDRREGPSVGIGQESRSEAGALAFWKGRWFVSLLASGETPGIEEVLLELGRLIAGAIHEEGEPPALLALLPDEGLVAGEIRYFHSQASLDRYFLLPEGNPLGLSGATEGILARLTSGEEREPGAAGELAPATLLLVAYSEESGAQAALDRLDREMLRGIATADGVRSREGTWAGAVRAEGILAAIFGAPSSRDLSTALARIRHEAGESF